MDCTEVAAADHARPSQRAAFSRGSQSGVSLHSVSCVALPVRAHADDPGDAGKVSPMKSVFVSVVGQDDNIGDSILRRGLLNALREDGVQLHVHIGDVGCGYVSGLDIRPDDVVYRSRHEWRDSMRMRRANVPTSYVGNAGEILRMKGPRQFGKADLLGFASIRARGGSLISTGLGIRTFDTASNVARVNAFRAFDLVTWRDRLSRDHADIGEVRPDWGFACDRESEQVDSRDVLAVSVRGDRPLPAQAWFDAVRRVAVAADLRVVTFAQVARDDERAVELSESLGSAEAVRWSTNSHRQQERLVRELFGRAAGVISDRLHALIVGATEGAYPIGLPPEPNQKSQRTLAPADFAHYVEDLTALDQHIDQLAHRPSPEASVAHARAELNELTARMRVLLGGRKLAKEKVR